MIAARAAGQRLGQPVELREERRGEAARDHGGIRERRGQRLGDLGLEPGLLVQPDAEVGEQEALGAGRVVGRAARSLVVVKRGGEQALPVGGIARAQVGAEGVQAAGGSGGPHAQEAGEFAADLVEHLPVAARHGVGHAPDRQERRPHVAERVEDRAGVDGPARRAAHLADQLDGAAHDIRAAERVLDLPDEVVAADALPRLSGRPGSARDGAPGMVLGAG